MFCYWLADKHCKSVKQLLREYDNAELTEWMVYHNRDHYKKVISEKCMTAQQRADLIKATLFGKSNVKHR